MIKLDQSLQARTALSYGSFCLIRIGILAMSVLPAVVNGEEVRTWTDATGKHKREGVFEKLEDGQVHLRGKDGKPVKIPLTRLSDADQRYASQAAAKASEDDPFTIEESGPARSEAERPSSRDQTYLVDQASADDPKLKKVFAEGVGKDVEKAKKNAYREAVRQVVGAYVDAENVAINRKLIEDRITMLSSAFVERSEEPEVEQTEDGLIRVRLLAYVRQTKVLDVLRENKVTVRVNTDSLVAELTTKTDQQEAQQDIMSRVFRGYPSKCFKATIEGPPRIDRKAAGSSAVIVRVKVAPDIEGFRKYSEQIHAALSASERPAGSFSSDGKKLHPRYDAKYLLNEELFGDREDGWNTILTVFPLADRRRLFEAVSDKSSNKLLEIPQFFTLWNGAEEGAGVYNLQHGEWEKLRERQDENNKSAILIVLSKSMADNQRTTWRWYALTAEETKTWLPAACHKLSVSVVAKDSSETEILEDTFELQNLGLQVMNVGSRGHYVYVLAPFFVSHEFMWYVPTFTYHRLIPASEEEIGGLKSLTCTLANGEVPSSVWGIKE